MIITTKIATRFGDMIAGVKDDKLCLFDYEYRKMMPSIKQRIMRFWGDEFEEGEHPLFAILQQQLDEYVSGERQDFDLPIIMSGTPFQQNVWQALSEIPYGETRTYMQQSRQLGDEKAIRAVARANGENCLAIIIPCHRVLGSDGSLTGYAGGINVKKWLIQHEARYAGKAVQSAMF